ncbi:MAG: threonine synthase [Prevotella sp.]|jgi:threonine synthase
MRYYSTKHQSPEVSLKEAVVKGLAPDNGLYMPEKFKQLPAGFFNQIDKLSFQELSFIVAKAMFGDDIEAEELRQIVFDTLSFPTPVIEVEPNIYALELFHGPTLAFKDVGARFMARMLRHFLQDEGRVNVLVATSGDTGSAVANGFLGVEGIHVYVLYPKGKVSKIQESQFTTLGNNITALEVDGVFDDCQSLVKQAFLDKELNENMRLTSANSINVARLLPQAFYYFNAYSQLKDRLQQEGKQLVFSTPSGNFGNMTAGVIAKRMGLPVKHFIAANNANDVFYQYLLSGEYHPMPSKQTLANAMDVGAPSNFDRILNLYGNNWMEIKKDIHGATYKDEDIKKIMRQCYEKNNYVLDPHGSCGYQALKEQLGENELGVFLETAHPAKFKEKVDAIIGVDIAIPDRLAAFMKGTKQSVAMPNSFKEFKDFLLSNNK